MKTLCFWLTAALATLDCMAQVPQVINYQGRLLDGTNLVNRTVQLALRMYAGPAGGAVLYEDSSSVPVVDGLYSTFIGDHTTAGSLSAALTNAEVWLEVAVDGTTLAPRERVVSVAYALVAESADSARVAQGVTANAITPAMLATGAVQGVHLAPGAVDTAAIADGSISAADLGSNAVTTVALADGAVKEDKIRQGWFPGLIRTIDDPFPLGTDYFGESLAGVGTNWFAVGATHGDAGGVSVGTVYLFDYDGNRRATIANPTPVWGDEFGCSVAAVGSDGFVVGACRDDTGATDAGSAYLFDLDGTLLATATNPAPASGDLFGHSVAGVGSERFVVGAPWDDTGAVDAGSAYLLDRNGVLLATITNPTPSVDGRFGYSVAAVSETRFIVTADRDDTGATGAGIAHLYDFNGVRLASITNPVPEVNDSFGSSVAGVGSNRFVIGASGKDMGWGRRGGAFLYDADGNLLATVLSGMPGLDHRFGDSVVGVGSNRFIVGDPSSDEGASGAGRAFLYDLDGHLLSAITNPVPTELAFFAGALGQVGADRFVVGAEGFDNLSGHVYLYSLQPYAEGLVAEGVRHGGVTTDAIQDGSVTAGKIAVGAIFNAHVAAGSLTSDRLVDGIDSGLDADLLDGLDSSAFASSAHSHTDFVAKAGDAMTGALILPALDVGDGSLTVDAFGNVGIGTNNPQADLHVKTSGQYAEARIESDSPLYSARLFLMNDAGVGLYANVEGTGILYSNRVSLMATERSQQIGSLQMGTFGGGPVFIVTSNATRLTVTPSGWVGIGTANPQFPLTVQGPSGSDLISWRNPACELGLLGWGTDYNCGLLWLHSNGVTKVSLRANGPSYFLGGHVGIGISNPTSQLQVVNAACDGNTWINASDRDLKEGFRPVDGEQMLEKVAVLPIREWRYKGAATGIHIGPTAQDFHAAFGLGDTDRAIATVDADGVALAAIQGLYRIVKEQQARIKEQEARIEEVEVALRQALTPDSPSSPSP